jgi:hypothetical protein
MAMVMSQNNCPQNITGIQVYFRQGDLFLSPEEYQRVNAWDLDQKRLLIDSIFRGYDIPKFYLWRINAYTLANGYPDTTSKQLYKEILERKRKDNDDPDPFIFEVVDGQQRIRTILEYMGEKPPREEVFRGRWYDPFPALPKTPMADNKLYSQLNAAQQIAFGNKALSVVVLETATMDDIRDMFLRLQNGTPLNAQQKRDAIGASIGRIARELAELPFFTKSVNFDNIYGDHHRLASQMLCLELKGKIVTCTSAALDKLYEIYKKTEFDRSTFAKVKGILIMLGRIFPDKNHHLNRAYALSLYWLFSRLTETYPIAETDYFMIRENFERLDDARLQAMSRDYSNRTEDDIYRDLSDSMSRGTDGPERISDRHDILSQFLLAGVHLRPYPKLDPNRDFTYEEKLIPWRRAEGLCLLECGGRVCGRQIEFDDAVVDHIVPHSRGGMTTLENGRIAYKSCNIARGNRDDFDPAISCHLLRKTEDQAAENQIDSST